jgi:hypothetical protein
MIAQVLGEGEAYQCSVPQCEQPFVTEKDVKAHLKGYHGILLQKDWTAPMCKLIQRFKLVGEDKVDVDANVMERREGGVEVRMRTGEGGMEECRKMPRGKYPKKRGIG